MAITIMFAAVALSAGILSGAKNKACSHFLIVLSQLTLLYGLI